MTGAFVFAMTTNHDDINGSSLRKQASEASIEVSLLTEQLALAKELVRSNGWSDEEGYQIIFVNGLHFLLGERRLQSLDCDHDSLSREVERLTRELMEYQSMYAAMKYKAFTLSEEKYVLEGNVSGLEASDRFATSTIKRFRQEKETLKSRIRELEEEVAALRQSLGGEETAIRLRRDTQRADKRSWWPWKR
jgi:chromosome segregation ATPase